MMQALLEHYRDRTLETLLDGLPSGDPAYLYSLVPEYPKRAGKGLRAALCLAACRAFGGAIERALNSAAAIELFHNAFLVHDDVQDDSEMRRGGPTLHHAHGTAIAINVGNAMNLLALDRLRRNKQLLGPNLAWRILEETYEMMRHSLEGQALELAWIHDNTCELLDADYCRMCLKKTSWYTCIYPLRVGALIATNGELEVGRMDKFGWYLGAAFQIQDDVLNLVGAAKYGKEHAGDLLEGKRTLMLIHLLREAAAKDRMWIVQYLSHDRAGRSPTQMKRLLEMLKAHGSIEYARAAAQELANAATREFETAFGDLEDSPDKTFLRETVGYVIDRDW